MSLISTIRNTVAKKIASRVRNTYGYKIDQFHLSMGTVSFANWKNPTVPPKQITQGELDFLRRFIKLGSFCLDIGANVGDTTVTMVLVTGKEGLVIGFDPNPLVYEILTVNAGLNKAMTNIVTVPYAITEEPGEFTTTRRRRRLATGGVAQQGKSFWAVRAGTENNGCEPTRLFAIALPRSTRQTLKYESRCGRLLHRRDPVSQSVD